MAIKHTAIFILTMLFTCLMSCASSQMNVRPLPSTTKNVRIPRLDPALNRGNEAGIESVVFTAKNSGHLALKDNCVRLMDDRGRSFLLIWENRFNIQDKNKKIQVFDTSSGEIFPIGAYVVISGGGIDNDLRLLSADDQKWIEACGGPYLRVSSIRKA